MKKKLITLTLTALMVMTMAACGDKPAESTGNSAAESETESTQEVSAKIEDETGETDVAEDDTENSAVSESNETETETADATESEVVEIDWDNMDWTYVILTCSGTTPDPITGEETEWSTDVTYGSLLYMANEAEAAGCSIADIYDKKHGKYGTYDQLDDKAKALGEAIMQLTKEERSELAEIATEQLNAQIMESQGAILD